ncbi:MAG TPA: hypothetical protein VGF00_15940 [Acidimicrobiia bacterium]|jgi:hypothetical protein
MMMFKRKKTDPAPPLPGPRPTASAPDRPPMPVAAAPDETAAEPRTTCYPQDSEAPPPVLGQPRTTVYRQAVRWNRGGYDTTN